MKTSVDYIRSQIRSSFGLSCRGTKYVEDIYFGCPLSRDARAHLNRNGGKPSARTLAALEFLTATPVEVTAQHEAVSKPQVWPDWSDEMSVLELCRPDLYEIKLAQIIDGGEEWWNRQGKYEEAAEEQGTYKDYLYACQVAEQMNEPEPHISEFVHGKL